MEHVSQAGCGRHDDERAARTVARSRRWTTRAPEFLRAAIALALAAAALTPSHASVGGATLAYFIADGDPRAGFLPADRELATWAFEAWARQSQGALTLHASPEPAARVRLYWAPLGDSMFGEMKPLTVNGEPGAAVFVTAGIDALGPDIVARARGDALWRDTIVFLTCLHEIGHAMGLPHTADDRDIMYSFGYGGDIVEYFARYRRKLKVRLDMRIVSGMSAADVQRFRALHPAK